VNQVPTFLTKLILFYIIVYECLPHLLPSSFCFRSFNRFFLRRLFLQGWYCLGVCYVNLQQFSSAQKALLRAAELAPKDVMVLSSLGDILRKQCLFDDALEAYNSALQESPTDIVALKGVADVCFALCFQYNTMGWTIGAARAMLKGIYCLDQVLRAVPKASDTDNATEGISSSARHLNDSDQYICIWKLMGDLCAFARYLAPSDLSDAITASAAASTSIASAGGGSTQEGDKGAQSLSTYSDCLSFDVGDDGDISLSWPPLEFLQSKLRAARVLSTTISTSRISAAEARTTTATTLSTVVAVFDSTTSSTSSGELSSFVDIEELLNVAIGAYQRVIRLRVGESDAATTVPSPSQIVALLSPQTLADSYYDLGSAFYYKAMAIAQSNGQVPKPFFTSNCCYPACG
jgi:hypothetical protein